MKTYSIDYLQFSSPERMYYDSNHELLPEWIISDNSLHPVAYYKYGVSFTNGVRVYWGHYNSDKLLYVLSGSACERLNVNETFVKDRISKGAKFSRIDFAITTEINFLVKMVKSADKVESRLYDKMKVIIDRDVHPETIYMGELKKRSRNGIIRAYDKKLESGLDFELYRFEYESRSKRAEIDAKRYSAGQSIPSIIMSRFNVDSEWFLWLMNGETEPSTIRLHDSQDDSEIQKKMSWIMRQVIPSLKFVKEYDENNGSQNFDIIMRMLNISEWT